MALTVRHFFPQLNCWLDNLKDTRDQDAITYSTRFMAWWGICLYLLQLSSRRQLDYELSPDSQALANINRLAQTHYTTRPVHDTLDYFVGHVAAEEFATTRTQMVHRLVRMKALDEARLLSRPVVILDATGLICWRRRHCPHCLTQQHDKTTLYLHQVLEAKLLGPAGVVVSAASEFIDNTLAIDTQQSAEQFKQDCELKAFDRLAPQLKKVFPQSRLVISGDNLYACGRVFAQCQTNNWSYVLTFKEGRMPAVWADFQGLLLLSPNNVVHREQDDGTGQVYRWVEGLSYEDDQKRRWTFNGLECQETSPDGTVTRFAWLTDLPLNAQTVVEVATKGGRNRWKIENEGFNRQKNSGLNLCHVYSTDEKKWKAYYYLLQIAFIITQLLERGSLLRQLTGELGRTPMQLFGSLRNIARRLLEAVRWQKLEDGWLDATTASQLKIRFDSS